MITLFQFYRAWSLPNASGFCMKLETYLRMAQLPYECKFVNNPQKSPKGKLPYIKIDGISYSDSGFIIDELKKRFGDVLDKELTPEQQSLATLIDVLLCERLYWITVYIRWQDDAGWEHVKKTMFGKLTFPAKLFVPKMIRKYMLNQLKAQGMGRHNLEEVAYLAVKSLDALSVLLGEKAYFLSDKPSSVDAVAFAFLANVLWTPFDDPIKAHVLKLDNLVAYSNRMWDQYYSDFKKPEM